MRSTPSAAPGASRRARDALLLELGALVYELHRKGQRAPELLQAKAVALDQVQDGIPVAEALPCPHCFAATEPGQLVCLECGETLGLGAPRVPKRRTPLIALAALVALLGAAGAGFAVSELTSDDDGGGAGAPAALAEPDANAGGAREKAPASGVAGSSESGPVALAAWPEDVSAYTVVLVTSSDEAGARKVAWGAARSGLEAGLLRSDDYLELGEGFWLVFAGRFRTAAAAERRAVQLGEHYEGAYPQQVAPEAQSPQ
jgi:hypothetical protein